MSKIQYYELISRAAGIPPAADFSVIISDDCMLPHFKPGERVYLSCREELREMDAGLFFYGGEIVCRQWCEDYSGALLLLCSNPDRQDRSIRIEKALRGKCICLGKVLTDKPLSAPLCE